MYFREELYNSITASLQTITVANGYATDIGNYIYQFESDVANEDEVQVYLLDSMQTFYDMDQRYDLVYPMNGTIFFDIKIQIRKGTDTLQYLRNAVLDVEKMIGTQYETLRALYPSLRLFINSNEITIEREEHIIGTAKIELNAHYTQKSFDPDVHC